MSWSSCWNSVGCLESWKESLTSLRTWSGLLAGGITLFVAIMTLVLWKFDSRISVLAAPRHLTEWQKKTLLENLNGVSEASVYFWAYSTSDESQAYAGELKAIFGEAGWQTHGLSFLCRRGTVATRHNRSGKK